MTNYFDYPLESDSVTPQHAKKEFEYWKDIFEDEIIIDLFIVLCCLLDYFVIILGAMFIVVSSWNNNLQAYGIST